MIDSVVLISNIYIVYSLQFVILPAPYFTGFGFL